MAEMVSISQSLSNQLNAQTIIIEEETTMKTTEVQEPKVKIVMPFIDTTGVLVCHKCGNHDLNKLYIYKRPIEQGTRGPAMKYGARCMKCCGEDGKPTFIKWVANDIVADLSRKYNKIRKEVIAEAEKKTQAPAKPTVSNYNSLVKMPIRQITLMLTKIVMRFVSPLIPPADIQSKEKEVMDAIWKWLNQNG